MTVVAEEDASHAIWPSCPARGWSAGVEKLTARPVPGAELVPHQLKERTLETHGPCTSVTSPSLRCAALRFAAGETGVLGTHTDIEFPWLQLRNLSV